MKSKLAAIMVVAALAATGAATTVGPTSNPSEARLSTKDIRPFQTAGADIRPFRIARTDIRPFQHSAV